MDTFIEKIIQSPLFLRLKDVVENNPYHDHENVYSHSIKTKDVALREIAGDFISNPEAKKSFLKFTDEEFSGMKRADIMILVSLLHDIGKILYVKDDDQTQPLLVIKPDGTTFCPGHEYWGSRVVEKVVKDLSLPKEIIDYMANIIKLHDSFGADYFKQRSNWTMELLINDVKSRAEGLYKETLFNAYCDCYNALPFQEAKKIIVKIFNEPSLYESRQYVIL